MAEHLDVRCAHYRAPNGPAAALAAEESSQIVISDRFRRDFPFARWHRSVSWIEQVDGVDVIRSKLRESVVHKTNIRERCQFCDTGGNTRAYNSADQTQHLSALPAPDEAGFRSKLCPFCFRAA